MSGRVFVLMPFAERLKDIWHFGILQTCQQLGWTCVRADNWYEPGAIIEKIQREISVADLVIAELTDRNPNVFYELGFAHALGKPTILLASSQSDLTAFDTSGYQHILHDNSAYELSSKLAQALMEVELPLEHAPHNANTESVFEWPSADGDRPVFEWTHQRNANRKDLYGGQSVRRLDPIGEVISVTNTDEYWNHRPGWSIMRLGARTNCFHSGDTVSMLVEARAVADEATITLTGDGGKAHSAQEGPWACSWHDKSITLVPRSAWTRRVVSAIVTPTHPDYDPAIRGTTVFLMTSVRKGTVQLRRIQVGRTPVAQ